MKRYEKLAQDIAALIKSGVLAPGDRAPSVRHASKTYGVSPSTVHQAYYLLENRGLIRSRPKSGFFVCRQPRPAAPPPEAVASPAESTSVDVSELVFSVLGSVRDPAIVPFGSAFPSPALFPLQRLARSLAKSSRLMDPQAVVAHLPTGSLDLRRQIAQRYAIAAVQSPLDEVIITNGALEALNLCLQTLTRPGDLVAIETPAFYANLQALERLGLQALEIPADPVAGVDLRRLEDTLARYPVKACWFMTNFQNPLGASMPEENKRALVALLGRFQVPLIEDDVYNELYFGRHPPKPAKAFDQEGNVLHCGSFSKTLAPGYRVGWVSAGRHAQQVRRLKLMTTLSTSLPVQLAIADYLQFGGYDRHLRKLRHTLEVQQNRMMAAIDHYFPEETRVTRPEGGYFLWLELPRAVDSLLLFQQALEVGISIAPGPMFSARRGFRNCIRLNYGSPWTPELEEAMATLGGLVKAF